MPANTNDVSAAEFGRMVVERSHQVPVVVDFWAAWCGPCKVLGPTLERLAEEGGGSWELAKVDVDQNQQLAQQFKVQGIPTVVAFKDGQPVSQFTGALPEPQVRSFIESLVPSELDLVAEQGYLALEAGNEESAEAAWRSVLGSDPVHEAAGLGLAGLLVERGDSGGALEVLERLPPTEGVRRLQAAARLAAAGDLGELEHAAAGGGSAEMLAYGRALAAAGRHEDGLTALLEVVERREPDLSDQARVLMLDLFELLGADHPLTTRFRRRLASALF